MCSRCKREKDDNEFYKEKHGKGGLTSYCKECSINYHLAWQVIHRVEKNEYNRNRNHNMVTDDYNKLLKLQNNLCAICGKPENRTYNGKITALMVDHDHKTGKIRGLLCHHCNIILGHMRDELYLCDKVKEYLTQSLFKVS